MQKLNLGCGTTKLPGCTNVDMSTSVQPDIVHDIRQPLPFDNDSQDEVYLFHTIEHLEKVHHAPLLNEVWRVLKEGSKVYLSFPEFTKVVQNWLDNKNNNREFWEHTIFGRQLYLGDYHLAAITTEYIKDVLHHAGFKVICDTKEANQDFNSLVIARKCGKPTTYEDLLAKEIFNQ